LRLQNVEEYATIVIEMTTISMTNVLFSQVCKKILKELVLGATDSVHLRELARRTKLDPMAVRREINKLVLSGIAEEKRIGNMRLFSMNKKCPIYPEIRMIVIKTMGVVDAISSVLEPAKEKIKFAYIYGSFAKGDFNASSDVDILVVGDIKLSDLVRILSPIQEQLTRELNPSVYSLDDYYSELTEGNQFVTNIHNGDKIMLTGEIDES
jgi:predicted nucleotidyltransferase